MRRTIIKACAILIGILCMFYMYKGYVGYQMVKGIVDQPPIVFSVRFKNGDRGTFQTIYFRNCLIVMIMKRL